MWVLHMRSMLNRNALRESTELDLYANLIRLRFASDEDIAWRDIVMEEASFVNTSKRLNDSYCITSQFLLCQERKAIVSHERNEVLIRPLRHYINVLFIFKVFDMRYYVCLL